MARVRKINEDNPYNVALRCDGSSSCEEAGYVKIIGDGDVYCSGFNSCRASVIKYTDGGGLVNVYCLGEGSCYGAEIAGITNLYCFEYQSCFAGFIIALTTNLYGFGYQSLYESTIYDMEKVYCAAYQSCRNAKIAQVNEIFILGYQALLQAQINPQTDNLTNNLYCIGYGACWEGNLQSIENIYASGDYSLYNAYISGFRTLHINSEIRGLNLAYIRTNIWETNWVWNKTVVIDITGTNDEIYNVYCDRNSTCHVYCRTEGACGKQIIVCEGECDIDCPYESKFCPSVHHDNETLTYPYPLLLDKKS